MEHTDLHETVVEVDLIHLIRQRPEHLAFALVAVLRTLGVQIRRVTTAPSRRGAPPAPTRPACKTSPMWTPMAMPMPMSMAVPQPGDSFRSPGHTVVRQDGTVLLFR